MVHHQVEDDALWPALRATVAAHPDQLALVDALEEEHAVIDPLLRAVDVPAHEFAADCCHDADALLVRIIAGPRYLQQKFPA